MLNKVSVLNIRSCFWILYLYPAYSFVWFTTMLLKLTSILLYALWSFFVALSLYPSYIALLRKYKAWKQIREDTVTGERSTIFAQLHGHKAWTPTMGGGLFLVIVALMVLFSYVIQYLWLTNNSLVTRQETYILLFAFFSMGILWFIDDRFNIIGKTAIKWMTAKMKMLWMWLFSAFISYRFFSKLGVDEINLRPFAWEVSLGRFMPVLTFFFTISLVNAINITDGLDWLAAGLLQIVLWVMAIITFVAQRYLATTIIAVVLGVLLAFLWFNIHPAKIFMGDSGALALWGLLATLVYLLNIRYGIFVPFVLMMTIFWIEIASSFLQIMSKKYRNKKLFTVAPFHHLLEHQGYSETTIVMKFWVIQWVLAVIALIMVLYQTAL